mgnify:FL=1|jgi:hypothetical protein
MSNYVDYVITELTVDLTTSHNVGRASFIFIDLTPTFPKVANMLDQIKQRDDAYITNYSISTTEITESTDLTGLEFTTH